MAIAGILPWITAGLGVAQAAQSKGMANRAIQTAEKPRFTEEMATSARRGGTSNILANLASRGLLDSSLQTGGLASLERGIAEARAGAGTMGDVPSLMWQYAMGLGQGAGGALGSSAQMYLLSQLLRQPPVSTVNPWMFYQPQPQPPGMPVVPSSQGAPGMGLPGGWSLPYELWP